jgi:hypothetical protein
MSISRVKGFDPAPIINKISKTVQIDKEGKVSFSGFEMFDHEAVLSNMLSFPEDVPQREAKGIIQRSLFEAAKDSPINPQKILSRVQRMVNAYYRQQEKPFVLLTTVSLQRNVSIPTTRPRGATVTFQYSPTSSFLAARSTQEVNAQRVLDYETPYSYSFVRVFVRSRTPLEAADRALDALDLVRGTLNWWENRRHHTRITYGVAKPINKVLLGPLHTLHGTSGDLAADTWWYEPYFRPVTAMYSPAPNTSILVTFYANIRKGLQRHPYRRDLENAILRYGRALDDSDHASAFQKLWGVLELLTCTNFSYKDTIRRTSFIYGEHEYHRQVLYHLKEFRNAHVHEDASSDSVEIYLYQLKNYVEDLLSFHLTTGNRFETLDDVSEFMDVPPEIEKIRRRKRILESAERFRSH